MKLMRFMLQYQAEWIKIFSKCILPKHLRDIATYGLKKNCFGFIFFHFLEAYNYLAFCFIYSAYPNSDWTKKTIKKKQQQQQRKQPLVSASKDETFQVARHLQHINFVMKPFLSFNSSLYNKNVHVYFTSIQSKHSSYQGTTHTQMDF